MRELLEAVRAPGQKHEVLRRLRALLEARPGDPFWIVCLGCAVGSDHVGVNLEVDLRGDDKTLDFSTAP